MQHGESVTSRRGLLDAFFDLTTRADGQVTAWQHRGGVPHAVAATSGLVAALLHDQQTAGTLPAAHTEEEEAGDEHRPSTASGRFPVPAAVLAAVYSAMFAAFVTGYLDAQQTGAAKRSMHDLAAGLAMPREFVAVRHAIAHQGGTSGGGPSLRELRRVSRDGLRWIYDRYWCGILDERIDGELLAAAANVDGDDKSSAAARTDFLRRILTEYVAKREAELKRRFVYWERRSSLPSAAQEASAALLSATGSVDGQLSALAELLMTPEYMLREKAVA